MLQSEQKSLSSWSATCAKIPEGFFVVNEYTWAGSSPAKLVFSQHDRIDAILMHQMCDSRRSQNSRTTVVKLLPSRYYFMEANDCLDLECRKSNSKIYDAPLNLLAKIALHNWLSWRDEELCRSFMYNKVCCFRSNLVCSCSRSFSS